MSNASGPMERMLAEWQIRDVVGRYARGVDRRDGDIIRGCFHAGAPTHYGDFDKSIDTFVPWVLAYVENYKNTMHFMGRTIIDWPERGNDAAVSETYATVWHEVAAGQPGRSWVGGIRYLDRFERREAAPGEEALWRIAERTVAGDWLRIDPSENHRRFAHVMLTGQPDRSDPVYAMLSKLGVR